MRRLRPTRARGWLGLSAAVLAAAVVGLSCHPEPRPVKLAIKPAGTLGKPVRVGRLKHPAIVESSGIVASRRHPGVYWTMNDSGSPPRIYAVDQAGKCLRAVHLRGATNRDWEDIAADVDGMLYVADVGDNARRRKGLTIYCLPEPDPKGKGPAAVKFARRFRYPPGQGPFDCEAMFVRRGWAYLVTKERARAALYRVALAGKAGETGEAEFLGTLSGAAWVTAADISPDGLRIAVLTYLSVMVYELPAPPERVFAPPASGPASRPAGTGRSVAIRRRWRLVRLGQCEAICWRPPAAGAGLLITNEGRDVYRIPPAAAATRPATSS